MPLSNFQRDILKIIAANRTPESYVAGGAPITAISERQSGDFDIFHDRPALVEDAARLDETSLREAGYELSWTRQLEGIWSAVITNGPEPFKLEWAQDAAWRFYPVRADDEFGYVLHPADLITNKALAAAGRNEPRDILDLKTLSGFMPLPAAFIAACGKDIGMPPETVVSNINMFATYRQEHFDAEMTTRPINAAEIMMWLKTEITSTKIAIETLPVNAFGRLYIENGRFVVPENDKLGTYEVVDASHGGIAARFPDIPLEPQIARYGDTQ